MASFRRSAADPARVGRFGGTGPVAGTPFSQSQILHLMKTEFARARRYGFPVSCMLVQVDRLEALIDLHGGALREMVRAEVGKLVHNRTRGADHLGLASDDRYLVVMPHTGGRRGLHVAERLRQAFRELEFRVGSNELALQLSIGVASCDDQATLFFDTMLTQAEAALEYSVGRGGHCCSLFRKDQISSVEDAPAEDLDDVSGPAAEGMSEEEPPRGASSWDAHRGGDR